MPRNDVRPGILRLPIAVTWCEAGETIKAEA